MVIPSEDMRINIWDNFGRKCLQASCTADFFPSWGKQQSSGAPQSQATGVCLGKSAWKTTAAAGQLCLIQKREITGSVYAAMGRCICTIETPWSSLYGVGSTLYLAGSLCYTFAAVFPELPALLHAGADKWWGRSTMTDILLHDVTCLYWLPRMSI